MITYEDAESGYTVKIAEPLPEGLSREHVLAALEIAGGPMGLERRLAAALHEVTGASYLVHEDPRNWVFEEPGPAGKIVEITLTLEAG